MPTPAPRFPALTGFSATYVLAGLGLLAGPGRPWQALAGPGRPWRSWFFPGFPSLFPVSFSSFLRFRFFPLSPSPHDSRRDVNFFLAAHGCHSPLRSLFAISGSRAAPSGGVEASSALRPRFVVFSPLVFSHDGFFAYLALSVLPDPSILCPAVPWSALRLHMVSWAVRVLP